MKKKKTRTNSGQVSDLLGKKEKIRNQGQLLKDPSAAETPREKQNRTGLVKQDESLKNSK